MNGSCSKVCHSINRVCYNYNLNTYELNNCNINVLNSLISTDEKDLIVAGSILDLCYIRDHNDTALTQHEIREMLMYLCTWNLMFCSMFTVVSVYWLRKWIHSFLRSQYSYILYSWIEYWLRKYYTKKWIFAKSVFNSTV